MGTAVLNEVNITATHLDKHRRLIETTQYWHKFIISNSARIDRNTLLDSVLNTVFPNDDLIPLHFKTEYLDSHFLAKNCKGAIRELYNKGLVIPDPIYGGMLNVTIILGFKKLSDLDSKYHENILTVIHKRYNKEDGTLDLSRFHEDPGLIEYFPLFQPRILGGVLRICKGINVTSFNLSDNKINLLQPLLSIWNSTDLRKLDLSKNLIKSSEELQVLRKFSSLKEIILKGNPFCEEYNGFDYVQIILSLLPDLKKLDSVSVQKDDLFSYKINYLCSQEGFDFVDQFLDHYFILYDKQRSSLRDMYHQDATLTISCHYNKDRENYAEADLECYTSFARNLKTLSDITNSYDNMFIGCDNVMAILSQLPPTNHDPCSFTVDLVSFSYNFAMVTATGIFQEIGGQILAFNRIFVLVSTDGLQYFIINDKLHVNQASKKQFRNAFQEVSVDNVNALSEITSMNRQWSKKCLKDCDGDLKTALISFNDLFRKDEIPKQAFDRSFILLDPIAFNFKNGEYIEKRTANSSTNIFKPEEHIDKIIYNKEPKLWNEESSTISLNIPNKKVQPEAKLDDLKKQNDIFKLARKNLDLKMKQINDAKKTDYIDNNKNTEGFSQGPPANDIYLTRHDAYKQKTHSQEMNKYVGGLEKKVASVINKGRTKMGCTDKTDIKKDLHNRNIILVDLTDDNLDAVHSNKGSGNDKYFNPKNINLRDSIKRPLLKLDVSKKNEGTEKNVSTARTTVNSTSQINTDLFQDANIVSPTCTLITQYDNSFPISLPNILLNSNNDGSKKDPPILASVNLSGNTKLVANFGSPVIPYPLLNNQNSLPQYLHLSSYNSVKKFGFAKGGINNTKQANQKVQRLKKMVNNTKRLNLKGQTQNKLVKNAPEQRNQNVRLLSTLAKKVYRKLQRNIISTEWRIKCVTCNSKSVQRPVMSRVNFRLTYLAFSAYLQLVYRTKDRVQRMSYINFNNLYMIYKNFIRQPYGTDYYNSRVRELDDGQGTSHEKKQFARLNSSISNGICRFSTSKLNVNLIEITPTERNLIGENRIDPLRCSTTLRIGNTTNMSQQNLVKPMTSRKKECTKQSRKMRRTLNRRVKRWKKFNENRNKSEFKTIINNASVQGSPGCSSWTSKGGNVKTDVSDTNELKPQIPAKNNHRTRRRKERRREMRRLARLGERHNNMLQMPKQGEH